MSSFLNKYVFMSLYMCGMYTCVDGTHVGQEEDGSPVLSLSIFFLGVFTEYGL